MKFNYIACLASAISSILLSATALADEPAATNNNDPAASANKTVRVEIKSDDKVWQPTQFATVYQAKCLDFSYELRIDSVQKSVRFSISDGEAREYDITSSKLGQSMLNRKYFGRVGMSCDKLGLNIFFVGYDSSSGKPLPIVQRIWVEHNGTVYGDNGPVYEKEEFIEHMK